MLMGLKACMTRWRRLTASGLYEGKKISSRNIRTRKCKLVIWMMPVGYCSCAGPKPMIRASVRACSVWMDAFMLLVERCQVGDSTLGV